MCVGGGGGGAAVNCEINGNNQSCQRDLFQHREIKDMIQDVLRFLK